MDVEALRARWLNRRVLHQWDLSLDDWWPALVTWISDDGKTVGLLCESGHPDDSFRIWAPTSDFGESILLAE